MVKPHVLMRQILQQKMQYWDGETTGTDVLWPIDGTFGNGANLTYDLT